MDDAPRIAFQLEIWTKDVGHQPDPKPAERRIRQTVKEVTDALNRRIAERESPNTANKPSQSSIPATASSIPPATTPNPSYATVKSPEEPRRWRQTVECYGCGAPGHLKRECPDRGSDEKPRKTDKPWN